MRTLLISGLLVLCVSCGIPTIHKIYNNEQYSDLQCLSPKENMIIYRAYNTCPIFSNKPEPYDKYWEIISINKTNYNNYEFDLKFRGKVLNNVKTCNEPTTVTLRYLLDSDDKLLIDRMVERSDTVSSNRLFIYGAWNKLDFVSERLWRIEIRNNINLSIKERVFSVFNRCK